MISTAQENLVISSAAVKEVWAPWAYVATKGIAIPNKADE
jgi:hypothetical protein